VKLRQLLEYLSSKGNPREKKKTLGGEGKRTWRTGGRGSIVFSYPISNGIEPMGFSFSKNPTKEVQSVKKTG